MDPLTFIRSVWAHQPDGHFFLCYFDGAHVFRERSFIRADGWRRKPRLLSDGIDLYFCPNSFTAANRRNSYAQDGRWLYADLDEVNPEECRLRPTLAWETSPGRYQAAWLLNKRLMPDQLSLLNRWMTYTTGADKGGWSLTKVLRMPGSISHKREKPFEVKLLWGNLRTPRPVYPAEDMLAIARKSKAVATVGQLTDHRISEKSARQLVKQYGVKLPASARKMLRATKEDAQRTDRSVMLWKLENLLLEAGLPPGEVYVLAQASAYNKYRGQDREQTQLWNEIERAATRIDTDKPAPKRARVKAKRKQAKRKRTPRDEALKRAKERRLNGQPGTLDIPLTRFLGRPHPKPSWLVQDIWTQGACGVISGVWKGYKSMISLDLALSVATGDPFLGKFEVPKPASVLYLHEEGSPGLIADRIVRIAENKGLIGAEVVGAFRKGRSLNFSIAPDPEHRHPEWATVWRSADDFEIELPQAPPLYISTFPGLDLTEPDSLALLHDTIKLRDHKLAILESLYLITGEADEKEAADLKPVLQSISKISESTGCAIAISHHYNKDKDETRRKLARISGTGVIARWLASGVFLERIGTEQDHMSKLDAVHRDHPSPPTHYLRFRWDPEKEDDYNVAVTTDEDVDEDGDGIIQADMSKMRGNGKRRNTKQLDAERFASELTQLIDDNRDTGVPLSDAARNLGTSPQRIEKEAGRLNFKIQMAKVKGRSVKVLVP